MVAIVLLGTDNKQRGDGGHNVVRDRQQTEGRWWLVLLGTDNKQRGDGG